MPSLVVLATFLSVTMFPVSALADTTAPGADSTGWAADPTALVNPFIGTGSGGAVVGGVNTFPGASAPFGMVAWSPDTPSRPDSGGYNYADSATLGFSLTHASGAGCPIAGDVPILPTTGDIGASPTAATEPFGHPSETAHPGSYSVTLGSGSSAIGVRLAATTRTGIGDFSYPATRYANVLFKAGDSQAAVRAASVSIVGNDEVTGSVRAGRFCGMPNSYRVYFAARFDRPFAGYGTWDGTRVTPGRRLSASGRRSGAWVSFDTTSDAKVGLKVAVSYVSTASAEANLKAEAAGWDEAAVAARTRARWRSLLSEIKVRGGTRDQQVEFYTALYHALLEPSTFSDSGGQYLGMDGRVHAAAPGQAQYTTFSGWDIYRDEVPLLAALVPAQASAMMQSLVNDAAQGGWLPKWPVANGYTGVMGGDSSDAMIAEAYAFGARDFDTRAALAAMVKGATHLQARGTLGQGYYSERPGLDTYLSRGYVVNGPALSASPVPDGASVTLEYATDDYAIAAFAYDLGDCATYRAFLRRSQNWTNLYNTGSGYIQPRDAAGRFPAGDPVTTGLHKFGQSGFQEGNAAQYVWMVPQDLGGLISAMGGNAAADARLDTFFTHDNVGPNKPYYWAGNEPDILAPWIYDYAGQPYKTQAQVHKLLARLYSNTPGGEPGNDDLGAMSSWFVWGALGMYPETPGAPVLVLGAPLFPRIQLDLPGHHLVISAPGASGHGYVTHLCLNGLDYDRDWLPALDLAGTLDFRISGTPEVSWAASPADAPPSYRAGPLSFPPGVIPSEPVRTAGG